MVRPRSCLLCCSVGSVCSLKASFWQLAIRKTFTSEVALSAVAIAGVILESEELHRIAYNATFQNFDVRCKGQKDVASWSVEFYDQLQNTVGGGKPKMRWFFSE